jgi:hypothetical protein
MARQSATPTRRMAPGDSRRRNAAPAASAIKPFVISASVPPLQTASGMP